MRIAPVLLALLASTLLAAAPAPALGADESHVGVAVSPQTPARVTAPAPPADGLQEARRLVKQGQTAQAMEQVDRYLKIHPKDAQARFLKGLLLTEQHKTTEAIKEFTDLTRDYPELPEPYNNLAVLYAGQGEYQKAKFALEAAIRTHPSYATAQENLGDIYAKMASQAYDKALQLDRSNTTAQTKLALIRNIFTPPDSVGVAPQPAAEPARLPPMAAAGETKVAPPPARVATAKAPVASPSLPTSNKAAAVAPKPAAESHAKSGTHQANGEKAEKEESGHAAREPAAAEKAEVLKALDAWAKAWSAKNVKGYLAAYAKGFKTPDGEKRAKWEETRRQRISAPKTIHVAIVDPRVSLTGAKRAAVSFKQVYRSNTLKTLTTRKSMTMVKSGERWLIVEEKVGR